jgi:hypothetical protein
VSSNEYEDDDLDGTNQAEGTLLVRDLRKQLKAKEKALKAESRTRTVSELLKAEGANPAIAEFIPATVEPTQAALATWLNEKGAVFGWQPDKPPADGEDQDVLDPAAVNAYKKIAEQTQGSTSLSRQQEIQQAMHNAKSREELNEVIARFGA